MDIAVSMNGVPIRLTEERWRHITTNRDEMAGYYDDVLRAIEEPDLVLQGYGGALIALRGMGRRRYLAVVYRETNRADGFVVTSYVTSRIGRRRRMWPSQT